MQVHLGLFSHISVAFIIHLWNHFAMALQPQKVLFEFDETDKSLETRLLQTNLIISCNMCYY